MQALVKLSIVCVLLVMVGFCHCKKGEESQESRKVESQKVKHAQIHQRGLLGNTVPQTGGSGLSGQSGDTLKGVSLANPKKVSGKDAVNLSPEVKKGLTTKNVKQFFDKDSFVVKDTVVWGSCDGKRSKYNNKLIQSGLGCLTQPSYSCYNRCHMKKSDMIVSGDKFNYKAINSSIDETFNGVDDKKLDQIKTETYECAKQHLKSTDGEPSTESDCENMKEYYQCVADAYYKICKPKAKKMKMDGQGTIDPTETADLDALPEEARKKRNLDFTLSQIA